MLPDPADTIVALSSAAGPGARAIVRLSGPDAFAFALSLIEAEALAARPKERVLRTVALRLPNIASPLPANVYFWPAPRTYTGQDLVEIHTLSSPPLIDLLITRCLNLGARAAQPGEFTMRAFLAGKLDLTQAEAVLGVIEADDSTELQHALTQLAGGARQPLAQLREDLLNLLADVEAGLDFIDEDIHFVEQRPLLDRLSHALAHLTLLRKQIEERAVSARPFRVVLAGKPNAGKSMLFNALLARPAALVSPQAGTTRDYLEGNLQLPGHVVLLVDTAGLQNARDLLEQQAQALGIKQAQTGDLVIWCRESTALSEVHEDEQWLEALPSERVLKIATKCDLAPAPAGWQPTSAVSGLGLEDLKTTLAAQAKAKRQPALAPGLSRCRHHVAACLTHLRQAHGIVLNEDPPELLAAELRLALDELGAMVGAIYTDDLLDRIFSRFCIGK